MPKTFTKKKLFVVTVVMILALAIAFVTPPVAANLFIVSSMTGVPVNRYMKQLIPFIIILVVALIIIGFIPEITWSFINILR